jgi:hypothetical protein
MPGGTPVNRHWVVILQNGNPVIDWGNGMFQDILTGQFIRGTDADISHTILDDELDQLKHLSRIYQYDANNVYIYPLPEPPHRTID